MKQKQNLKIFKGFKSYIKYSLTLLPFLHIKRKNITRKFPYVW